MAVDGARLEAQDQLASQPLLLVQLSETNFAVIAPPVEVTVPGEVVPV